MMLAENEDQLVALTHRLYQLGYRHEWAIGDELWYARKRQPGLYKIEYIFHSRAASYIFIRRFDKTIRVSLDDDRLLHFPLPEDVLGWFKQQHWIDFYNLRSETDASYEFTFYYHKRAAYKTFHAADARTACLLALVAAYELMAEIIAD